MKTQFILAARRFLADAYDQGSVVVNRRRAPQVAGALVLGAVLTVPALAHAQTVTGGASPATMINNICTFILGPFGQSLAVLGI